MHSLAWRVTLLAVLMFAGSLVAAADIPATRLNPALEAPGLFASPPSPPSAVATQRTAPVQAAMSGLPLWVLPLVVGVSALLAIAVGALWLALR